MTSGVLEASSQQFFDHLSTQRDEIFRNIRWLLFCLTLYHEASSERANRYNKQVVASSKEIVMVTYEVVTTSKSLRVLKKSLR
ncbi:hypothetical protein Taro_022891 [Colocasia esculenta]|uniref:Uncharacterized protein n=1 Tax=Colocasia esculenta TaxID=4460 RepID=A0A843V991_COLES|nr:hypothetical protein [Colocasia esculenta]